MARATARYLIVFMARPGGQVVARRSGFGSEETMRRASKRELGIAPSTYRSRHRTTRAQKS